jgi:hypothetical protein
MVKISNYSPVFAQHVSGQDFRRMLGTKKPQLFNEKMLVFTGRVQNDDTLI